MYYVNAQGVDERMINVHYYYYLRSAKPLGPRTHARPGSLHHCKYLQPAAEVRDELPCRGSHVGDVPLFADGLATPATTTTTTFDAN